MNILLPLFGLINAADGWTTWQRYRQGGYELNPILARAIKSLGLYWALMLFKVGVVVGVWWWAFNGLDVWVLAGLDVVWAVVVIWNFYQLKKH